MPSAPPRKSHLRHLYDDVLVGIIPERFLNNGQPSGLATWLEALNLKRNEPVCGELLICGENQQFATHRYLEESLVLYEKLGDKRGATLVHSRLGLFFSNHFPGVRDVHGVTEPRRVVEHQRKAESQIAGQNDPYVAATVYINKAVTCVSMDKIDEGIAAARCCCSFISFEASPLEMGLISLPDVPFPCVLLL